MYIHTHNRLVLMYQRSRESIDHLLHHCEIESALWSDFLSKVRMGWACLKNYGLRRLDGCPQIVVLWKVIHPYMPHLVYLDKRNDRIFEDCEWTMEEFKSLFISVLLWTASNPAYNSIFFFFWIDVSLAQYLYTQVAYFTLINKDFL